MPHSIIRPALKTTAVFNLIGALAFLFPDSIGRLAGFPAGAPLLYRAALAFLVALFGATYYWLSIQPQLDRPLMAFSAIGKAGFFAIVVLCWLGGAAPFLAVFTASGDLAFAALFFWWLAADERGNHGLHG